MVAHPKARRRDTADVTFEDALLSTPIVDGAFDSLKRCVAGVGAENIYLVAYGGRAVESSCRKWMAHTDFFRKTGVLETNMVFCRQRKQKAVIHRRLKVTHVVDDSMKDL